ncbi:MAG: Dabb family protein [Prevotella sp.]|nr:Dabb family protein [Prevotella sp.]
MAALAAFAQSSRPAFAQSSRPRVRAIITSARSRNHYGRVRANFSIFYYFNINFFLVVKHIILWTLNPELSEEKKTEVKKGIKEGLEQLVGKVPGLIDVKVNIDGRLDSSNCDVMLDSTLESTEALKAYATHPEHVAVANTKVRPYTVQRTCLDYTV